MSKTYVPMVFIQYLETICQKENNAAKWKMIPLKRTFP
jgi:hypothetical protein